MIICMVPDLLEAYTEPEPETCQSRRRYNVPPTGSVAQRSWMDPQGPTLDSMGRPEWLHLAVAVVPLAEGLPRRQKPQVSPQRQSFPRLPGTLFHPSGKASSSQASGRSRPGSRPSPHALKWDPANSRNMIPPLYVLHAGNMGSRGSRLRTYAKAKV